LQLVFFEGVEAMTTALPLKEIHHVELLVGNAKQAAFYYQSAFGFCRCSAARGSRKRQALIVHKDN